MKSWEEQMSKVSGWSDLIHFQMKHQAKDDNEES
jgi:hypothetical protein